MMAWKRLLVHLYEVFTTLCDTSLFTWYTHRSHQSPAGMISTCRQPHVYIHTQVDNYPDRPSHCFHSFNCSMIIPWRKYFCLHNNVDKYFDDLDDHQLKCVNAVSIPVYASSLPHFLFNRRWQILVYRLHVTLHMMFCH